MPFDEGRDAGLLELCLSEYSGINAADMDHTVFLIDEPVGLIGLGGKAQSAVSNAESGREDEINVGSISCLYLKPDFRRMGFGVQLVGQAVSDCRNLKKEKLRARMTSDSPAISFFLKHQFDRIDEQDGFCLMEKNIRNW